MPRKRAGFVPLGDIAETVELIGESPTRPRHFTRLDQVTQLVNARDADPDVGFQARMMAFVFAAAHQPRQPGSVRPTQRAVHVG